ncbi:hypothetical protein DPMN_010969 [Dreissena polymorpha]|uniref:Reverse transcriptase n=1 Tax=Dreissena polymorpha TaxID=45954 RepID=A0A9D4N2Q2_DREPO|nr:hypothetical protein DPMN_010969 [Dreissena polymorpha]
MSNSFFTPYFPGVINLVLRGLTWKTVLAFLDDVLVLGQDFEELYVDLDNTV